MLPALVQPELVLRALVLLAKVFLAPVLIALVLLALVLPAPVLPVPVLLLQIHWCGARNQKETLSMRNYTIHDKDDRDVRNKHFVILLHNFKGIYAVLSRIWKCRKSRVFGANVLGEKFGWCYIFRFLQLW